MVTATVQSDVKRPAHVVTDLVAAFTEADINDVAIQDRIDRYAGIIARKGVMHSIPEVRYDRPQIALCCGVRMRRICASWNIFRTVMCCGVRNYYYVSAEQGDALEMNTRRTRRLPSEQQRKETNATFFLDLYTRYKQYLAPCWKECIAYMKAYQFDQIEIAYWEQWDPASTEHLLPQRVRFFRDLMQTAYEAISETKKEAMKAQLRLHVQKSPLLFQSLEQRLEDAASSSPMRVEDSIGDQEEEFSTPTCSFERLETITSDEPERFSTPVSPMPGEIEVEELRRVFPVPVVYDSSPYQQLVTVGASDELFSQEKIVQDLLEMTSCTEQQAKEIAEEVENSLTFPCNHGDIWEHVKESVSRRKLGVRSTTDSPIVSAVADAMNKDFELQTLPDSLFAEVIAAKQREKGRDSAFQVRSPAMTGSPLAVRQDRMS